MSGYSEVCLDYYEQVRVEQSWRVKCNDVSDTIARWRIQKFLESYGISCAIRKQSYYSNAWKASFLIGDQSKKTHFKKFTSRHL